MEAMTDTSTDLLLDLNLTLPCEGDFHHAGTEGHIVTEPGAFFIISPCGNTKVVQCRPRVEFLLKLKQLWCLTCRENHPIGDYKIKPI